MIFDPRRGPFIWSFIISLIKKNFLLKNHQYPGDLWFESSSIKMVDIEVENAISKCLYNNLKRLLICSGVISKTSINKKTMRELKGPIAFRSAPMLLLVIRTKSQDLWLASYSAIYFHRYIHFPYKFKFNHIQKEFN